MYKDERESYSRDEVEGSHVQLQLEVEHASLSTYVSFLIYFHYITSI